MKRKVKLCGGCVSQLKHHFPYLYPDGKPMKPDDLIIEEAENTEDCDNYPDNFEREPIWLSDEVEPGTLLSNAQRDFLSEAAHVVMNEHRERSRLLDSLSLSVIKINCNGSFAKYDHLFEFIPTYEEANLLAQFAMSEKEDHEIIAILPGWNYSIKKYHPTDYADALALAEKYKYVKMKGEK